MIKKNQYKGEYIRNYRGDMEILFPGTDTDKQLHIALQEPEYLN
ncbi:hypothetical protein Metlim_2633 [Methanoplanus limicola DSM 2279]|uniref:Uncharacterized protein n=1 Tax=Methanoplanus limicola DSM 2279 TaxID=937775 RepID=H1Z4C6_9EURY|nr:hypothetical protein Metlim_2633 [Methanoplanus limicola DSM 2279]